MQATSAKNIDFFFPPCISLISFKVALNSQCSSECLTQLVLCQRSSLVYILFSCVFIFGHIYPKAHIFLSSCWSYSQQNSSQLNASLGVCSFNYSSCFWAKHLWMFLSKNFYFNVGFNQGKETRRSKFTRLGWDCKINYFKVYVINVMPENGGNSYHLLFYTWDWHSLGFRSNMNLRILRYSLPLVWAELHDCKGAIFNIYQQIISTFNCFWMV